MAILFLPVQDRHPGSTSTTGRKGMGKMRYADSVIRWGAAIIVATVVAMILLAVVMFASAKADTQPPQTHQVPHGAGNSGWYVTWHSTQGYNYVNGHPCRTKTGRLNRYGYLGKTDVLWWYQFSMTACIAGTPPHNGTQTLYLMSAHKAIDGSTPDPTWQWNTFNWSNSQGGCVGGSSCGAYSYRQEGRVDNVVLGVDEQQEYPWLKIEAVVKKGWSAPQLRFYGWAGVN